MAKKSWIERDKKRKRTVAKYEVLRKQLKDAKDYKKLGQIIGRAFAGLANIFAPEAIILGGGVAQNAGNKFLPAAKKEMKKYLFDENLKTKILVSKLKNAGAIGAALLIK